MWLSIVDSSFVVDNLTEDQPTKNIEECIKLWKADSLGCNGNRDSCLIYIWPSIYTLGSLEQIDSIFGKPNEINGNVNDSNTSLNYNYNYEVICKNDTVYVSCWLLLAINRGKKFSAVGMQMCH